MLFCDMCNAPMMVTSCLDCGQRVGDWCPNCDSFAILTDDKRGCRCVTSLWQCWCDLCGAMSYVGGCPHITGHLVGVTCPETAVFTQTGDAFLIDDSLGTHFCPDCQKNTLPGECPHWEMVTDDQEIPF